MILNHLPRYTVCDDFTEGIMFLEHFDLSNFSRYNKSRRGQLRKKLQYLRSFSLLLLYLAKIPYNRENLRIFSTEFGLMNPKYQIWLGYTFSIL